MNKADLIKQRKQTIIDELGRQNETEIEEILINWFMQEFFTGEITRKELDEYAAEMGYSIDMGFSYDGSSLEEVVPQA